MYFVRSSLGRCLILWWTSGWWSFRPDIWHLLLSGCCARGVGLLPYLGKAGDKDSHDPSPLLLPVILSFTLFSSLVTPASISIPRVLGLRPFHSFLGNYPVSFPHPGVGAFAGWTPVHRALTPELTAPPLPLPGPFRVQFQGICGQL